MPVSACTHHTTHNVQGGYCTLLFHTLNKLTSTKISCNLPDVGQFVPMSLSSAPSLGAVKSGEGLIHSLMCEHNVINKLANSYLKGKGP